MENKYICDCGKIFANAQALGGHHSHCKTYMEIKGKSLKLARDEFNRHKKAQATWRKKIEELLKEKSATKEQEILRWGNKQHICEKCGKNILEKFGSGRFCSRSCANAHVRTEESRQKTKESIRKYIERCNQENRQLNLKHHLNYISTVTSYDNKPNRCVICNKALTYKKRHYQTCSKACKRILLSEKASNAVRSRGGNLNPHPNKNCKSGTYKGIHYDSSWELAFIMYNLDKGIKVARNKESFDYILEGKKRKYYPDFIIEGIYYEIKNFVTKEVLAKKECFPKNLTLNILYRNDMKIYLDYCKSKYGDKFWNYDYGARECLACSPHLQ